MRTTHLSAWELIHDSRPTPMGDIAFEAMTIAKRDEDGDVQGYTNKKPWPLQVINAILDEMRDAGCAEGLVECFEKKFFKAGWK